MHGQAVNVGSRGLLQPERLSQSPFSAFDVNTIFDGQLSEKMTRKNIYNLDVQHYGWNQDMMATESAVSKKVANYDMLIQLFDLYQDDTENKQQIIPFLMKAYLETPSS